MWNLTEIPVCSFVNRQRISWWPKEAEWLSGRLNKWLANYRGYSKLREGRISRGCQSMIEEDNEDGVPASRSTQVKTPQTIQRTNCKEARCGSGLCYSQPSSPTRERGSNSCRRYNKLRTRRISPGCQSMIQEDNEEGVPASRNVQAKNYQSNQRANCKDTSRGSILCYSHQSSPTRQNDIDCFHSTNIMKGKDTYYDNLAFCFDDINDNKAAAKRNEAFSEEEIMEACKKEFRQPYGWTDYINGNCVTEEEIRLNMAKKTESVKHILDDSNEDGHFCCYESCNNVKARYNNSASQGTKNEKKRGTFEVITDKLSNCTSQANNTCNKYFSLRRRHHIQPTQEDGFLTLRRRKPKNKNFSVGRDNKRIVYGGAGENDPMWPAVLLTFDRHVSPTRHMPLTVVTKLPETML